MLVWHYVPIPRATSVALLLITFVGHPLLIGSDCVRTADDGNLHSAAFEQTAITDSWSRVFLIFETYSGVCCAHDRGCTMLAYGDFAFFHGNYANHGLRACTYDMLHVYTLPFARIVENLMR